VGYNKSPTTFTPLFHIKAHLFKTSTLYSFSSLSSTELLFPPEIAPQKTAQQELSIAQRSSV